MHPLRLLPVLLALAACGTPAPSDPGPDAGPAGRDASTCAKPCGSDCCVRGQVCDPKTDTCVAKCQKDCDGRSCGDDGCGGLCGVCGPGTSCANGRCVACQPNCLGKQCGPDGCGSLCGVCGTGLSCSTDGLCTTCQPSCTGKQCGPNGCGGVCGTCASGTTCGTDGVCRATGGCNGNGDCAATPATPICDTSTRTCVACTSNTHCVGATPVCDLGAKQCVTCTAGAGCSAGLVCDLTVPGGRCTGCLSSANCSGATPVCDTATHACVACTAVEGCTSEGKVCDTSVAGGRCVQCLTTLHCGSGRFCDTATKGCVICNATQGCTSPQTCDTTVPGGVCRGCSLDSQCLSTPATPVCDPTGRCVVCTSARGCVIPQTCDTTVTGGRCVGCTMHADCLAPTPACEPSTARCVACTGSYGCSGATPKCKTGATPVCVGCLTNGDCTDGKTCNTATNTCIASTNVSQQIATARSQPDGMAYSLPISGALVTYVRPATGTEPAGYFVQGDAAGPALLVEDVATLPAVGDRVSFTITALGSPASAAFVGTRTVQALTGYLKESSGNPVAGLLQDLSSVSALATAPANYESEYVALRGVLGASAAADSGFLKYPLATAGSPTAPQPFLRLPQAQALSLDLAAGCTVQLKAGVLAVSRGAETQAQATGYRESDFTVVSCPAPRVRTPAVSASPTRVLVNFDRQIKASTVSPGAFTIPGLSVSAASMNGARQVALTTSVQTPGQAYQVSVAQTVTDTLGTPLANGATSASFQGFVTGTLGPANGGFESWTSPSSATSWTPGVGVLVAQETTNRHGGSYAVRLTRNSTVNAENELVGTLIPVQEGANYRVSAWFYDEDGNGKGNLGYSFLGASGNVLATQFATGFTADSAAWQALVVNSAPAPTGAVSLKLMLRVYAQNLPTGGTVLVDDVDVRAVANEPVALTGDFERWVNATTPEGWTAASGILVAQDSSVKHGGTYSAKLTRNSTTNNLVELSSGGLQVLTGTTYRIGMWFLDNSATARANLGYAWHDASNAQVGVVYGSTFSADGVGWQELTLTTDPAPANAASIRVFTRVYGQTDATQTGGFVNLDDVTLIAQ